MAYLLIGERREGRGNIILTLLRLCPHILNEYLSFYTRCRDVLSGLVEGKGYYAIQKWQISSTLLDSLK